MKKTFLYIFLAASALFIQCKDYLDVTNPGQSDNEFVMSSPEEAAKTLSWAYGEYRTNVAAGGNYNWQDPLGSDAEYMSEFPTGNNVIARLQPEASAINNAANQYNSLNIILARASRIAEVIQGMGVLETSENNEWKQLYGEAKTMWALCGWELVRHFGDVPFGYENTYVQDYELKSRFAIMDTLIAELKAAEGLMYKVGEGGVTAERLNRSYANALIGEIALHAGGWQTIRTDVAGLYGNVQFDYKGTDDGTCVYARRKDYMDYIRMAEQYLNLAVNTHNGTARLITTDSRALNNPFQVHWQEINSRRVSPESLYEVACAPGFGGEHPYSQGRPGSNNGAVSVLNTFAAIRIIPSFFYNGFEDGDKRRDVSMVVTGSDAATGRETLMPMGAGTRIGGGGPAINKWDQNRGDNPLIPNNAFRNSGMNYTVMRMADAMLMLAEAKAILGTDNGGAVNLVNQIRTRAFGNTNNNIPSLSGDALLNAIYEERRLELLGEGDVRWDMIRSGKFNERATKVRQEMEDMVAGLASNGYYTFPSGRTISNYIWTKHVQLNPGSSAAVVTQESTNPNDPARFPGWRGIYNWNAAAHASVTAKNLAIKGLYNYIDPNGSEAAALEADGYVKTDWAIKMLQGTNPAMYRAAILDGVVGRENMAPRYYHPMPLTVIDQSKGKVTNGYGLPNN
ncbi:RagB/SusD family nutrient uptake outer membrane protein [Sphingobacterium sp. FBM7-1]|uniref:RagB/SusD family nutrient uptake outer membrane protein n=1 Tax=Sphingobacterium sp. FBM7-1 TaxID=2886688 RepID=UPI001D0F564C|nr:RagB/SusD family nutrient uptake outer membrane protein [Sphingobacterium sp. FBM7-1]MCC2600730.1 RagB/SusD family nutrient uptake outer membrane protein [Sphingobacterium sp. FBM7-1]